MSRRPVVRARLVSVVLVSSLASSVLGLSNFPGSSAAASVVDSTLTQQAYLKASNTDFLDQFGTSIATSGDMVVVGAPGEDSSATGINGNQADNSANDSGAAYVFVRRGSTWVQQAYLKPSNTGAGDQFGASLAMDGDTIVVGAPFEDSAATGIDGNQGDNSAADSGAVYVFTRSGSTWTQQAYVKASNAGATDYFGADVSLDDATLAVGARLEDSAATGINGAQANESAGDSGAAYVFTRTGSTWTQQAYVKASNTGAGDAFGVAIDVDGNTLVVGAINEDGSVPGVNGNEADNAASNAGAAYVFVRSGSAWTQQAYLKSSSLDAGDAFGRAVTVSGDTLAVGAINEDSVATGINGNHSDDSATDAGAVYVFVRSASTWSQQAYVKAPNTDAGDLFGFCVELDGDVLAVTARDEDSAVTGVDPPSGDDSALSAGAAYLYGRTGSTWSNAAFIKASNTESGDAFATDMAFSGQSLVVGAPLESSSSTGVNGAQGNNSGALSGAAYVFNTTPPFPSGTFIKASNPDVADRFGNAIAMDGDTMVVGAFSEASAATGVNGNEADNSASGAGAAYVFRRSGSAWTQEAYLKASNTGQDDLFGSAVAISGNTVVIGAPGEDSDAPGVNGFQLNESAQQAGAAYVFQRTNGVWTQEAYLKASNPGAADSFGRSVAVSGSTIAVGAYGEDSAATGIDGNQLNDTQASSGAAYVFTTNGAAWTQQAYIKASNTGAGDLFGWSIALDDETLAVGAPAERSNATGVNGNQASDSMVSAGAAYVFTRSGSTWSQQAYLKASNTGADDQFGYSLALDGDRLVTGAPFEDSNSSGVNASGSDNSASNSGAAYVFERAGTTWSQEAYLKASNGESGLLWFGFSVAIDGDLTAVGAPDEDGAGTGVNGPQRPLVASSPGSSYAFERANDTWTQIAYMKSTAFQDAALLGRSIAVSGSRIAVGAEFEWSDATGNPSIPNSGAAYVFNRWGCVEAPFSDVATSHAFCPEIRWMYENGVSTGFGDGTYRPSANVARQAMSAFMARLDGAALSPCATAPFTDVPTTHPFCREIQWMKEEGISTGFGDGTYRPLVSVTRQAMSAFMARLAGAALPPCTSPPFSDVPVSHPFCEEIQWMRDSGVSTGFADGTYRPGTDVTRQAMSAFMSRVAALLD
jgi:hypothetical protein